MIYSEISQYLKKQKTLHHAYLFEGDVSAIEVGINDYTEKLSTQPHTVQRFSFDTLSIENARMIRQEQLYKSQQHTQKFFIIRFYSITLEAQNALLKSIEEPTQGTHFFFITPQSSVLLPTLLSRVEKNTVTAPVDTKIRIDVYTTGTVADRMKAGLVLVQKKDKQHVIQVLSALLVHVHSTMRSLQSSGKDEKRILPTIQQYAESLLQCQKYMYDRSPSSKQIVDYAILAYPL